ncbi:MAG: DPP IV N-terminal domain-containing protein [Anaerolineae bacterium]
MSRFVLRNTLLLALVFSVGVLLVGVLGRVLPSAGELRYILRRYDGSFTPYSVDVLRRLAFQWRASFTAADASLSPDDRYIIAQTTSGAMYMMDIRGGSQRLLSASRVNLLWSPDAQWIAFVVPTGDDRGVYLAHGDGTEVMPLFSDAADYIYLRFSPDSTHLAYVRNGDLYVLNLIDNTITPLTSTIEQEAYPDWSPDGHYLGYVHYLDDNSPYIYSIVAANGQSQYDFDGIRLTMSVWSQDGTQLAILDDSLRTRLYIFQVDTGTMRELPLSQLLYKGIHMEWREDDSLLQILSTNDPERVNPRGIVYQDDVDVMTGEIVRREQSPSNTNPGYTPELSYTGRAICVPWREAVEYQICFPLSEGIPLSLHWLP